MEEVARSSLAAWQTFFFLVGSSAAALTGLQVCSNCADCRVEEKSDDPRDSSFQYANNRTFRSSAVGLGDHKCALAGVIAGCDYHRCLWNRRSFVHANCRQARAETNDVSSCL